MDIIEKARELGRLIQEEDSYKKLQDAQKNADADMELQRLIGEFNLKRMSINNEASKKERDQEKLSTMMQRLLLMLLQTEFSQLFSSLLRAQIPKLLITASHHAQAAVLHAAVAADKRSKFC